jgi:hypothetical protein
MLTRTSAAIVAGCVIMGQAHADDYDDARQAAVELELTRFGGHP